MNKEPVARLEGIGLAYGKTQALEKIDLEIPAGPRIGEILNELLKNVVSGNTDNEKAALIKAAKKML